MMADMKTLRTTCFSTLFALQIACTSSSAPNGKALSENGLPTLNERAHETAKSVPSTRGNNESRLPKSSCEKNAKSFSAFLNEYVNRLELRQHYTNHEIEIRSFADPIKRIGVETAIQNQPFKIGLVDYQWSYVEASKERSSEPYPLIKIDKKLEGDSVRINFVKAQFTPEHDLVRTYGPSGAYIFQHSQGCWRLTQELR